MLATLKEAKDSSIVNVAGVDPDSPEFSRFINEATRRLLIRGDWPGTIVPIHVCVKSGCVVWPRYVGTVRKLNMCHNEVPIHNGWYDFLPYDRSTWGGNYWVSWLGAEGRMINQTRSPVMQDILGDGRTVRAYPSTALDKNKTIRVFGIDNNGQTLMTQGIGGWHEGVTIQMGVPYGETGQMVRSISRILKDETQGPVRLYAWYAAGSVLEDLAIYGAGETNPSYLRTSLRIPMCNGQCTSRSVVAMVKLQYVPAKHDDDLVLIENLDALKLMVMSMKKEESNDIDGKRQNEMDAIRELNLSLAEQNPEDQITIRNEVFNGTGIGRQQCF